MADYYLLDGHRAVPCKDSQEWAKWFEKHRDQRRVARTEIAGFTVSTVFLGLNHAYGPQQEPLLFETMVFLGDRVDEKYCERCSTWEEAEEQHRRAVAWAGCCAPWTVDRD